MQQNAREKALRLLLFRPRSEAELRGRLTDAGFTSEETEDAIWYAKGYGYVNDRRFAENYALSMQSRAGHGAIRMELRRKGVADSLIEEALDGLDMSEEEVLAKLLWKKAGQPHRMDEREFRRMYGFLARRGFSAGAVRRAIRSYEAEETDAGFT